MSTDRISIFTPSHNTEHLLEAYRSASRQDFYEWIVVLNNGAILPEEMSTDERVKVFEFEHQYVGALKKFACSKCSGDYLLELDHDDLLTVDAIWRIKLAISQDPDCGFFYSNAVEFKDGFTPNDLYSPIYGWRYRQVTYNGHQLFEPISFEPHPAAITKIWYAPNHVRVWKKDLYDRIGGHNEGMRVLDDQELMSRTYIHTHFHHIDEPLYLYRVTGNNTWLKHNQEIQDNVMPLYKRYIKQCAGAWADRNDLNKLELGGRFNPTPGFTTVDLKDADIIYDLNSKDWTGMFGENSTGCIVASDVFEHLPDQINTMVNCHRILADGGMLIVSVPSTDGRGAFQDPTHVSFWNQNSFWYYTDANVAKYIDTPVRFQVSYLETIFPSEWHRINNIPYVEAHLICLKDKSKRYPGELNI